MSMTSKERALNIIRGLPVDKVPAFSGMGNVIVAGLEKYKLRFAEVHLDAQMMADAASATHELVGTASVNVPFDMGVTAEALGATLNTYAHSTEILYPTMRDKYVRTAADIKMPSDWSSAGRVPLVAEAIRILKERYGDDVAVGSWVLGPFTLSGQSMDLNDALKTTLKEPARAAELLEKFTTALIEESKIYIEAGADFMVLREMGATPDVLSPRSFKKLVKSYSEEILATWDVPTVYHICGGTDLIIEEMGGLGADAVSVDQKNTIAMSREKLGPEAVILGNMHPFELFSQGTPERIREEVAAVTPYVDSVWPGCDLWPETPVENLRAWVETTEGMTPRRKA
jgi:[methyl-Co(III) methanol-specific corrinoid protein]:coenzyme M methyltransferase